VERNVNIVTPVNLFYVIGLGKVYLLNSLITPINFDKFSNAKISFRRVDVETVKRILSDGFISAVGHEATAQLLSKLLGVHVPLNRSQIFMEKGDKAIHFFLKQRLPGGVVLDEAELAKLEYWLILSEVEEVE
jgi:hypothetical protein